MKKTLAFLLAGLMLFSLCACGGSENAGNVAESEDATPAVSLETALNDLNEAYSLSSFGMITVLRAWQFSVDAAGKKTAAAMNGIWKDFETELHVTEEEMIDGLMNGCGYTMEQLSTPKKPDEVNTMICGVLFQNSKTAIGVARYCWDKNQGDAKGKIQSYLDEVKTFLSKEDSSKDYYATVKEYYLMVNEIFDWIYSPSGSLNSGASAYQDYETRSQSYQTELEIYVK